MLKVALLSFSFNILIIIAFSQPIENRFIDALIHDKDNITDYIDKDELNSSSRLGIEYSGVNHKWLISFDIPDEVKEGFKGGKYNYTLQTQQLEDGFSVVTLAVGSVNYLQKFYFLNDNFVHPSIYFTRNWKEIESRYFKFKLSEPKYFNDYCVKRLDDFVDSLCTLLEVEPERKNLLAAGKINYTFCIDENDVEKITGYKSKGMSVLAFDEVITAYQTHFHEVAHILINFKLQNLGLYTLPFFMEGFAVAVGGRGGMAPRVVTDLGYYLQKTGFLTYDSILTYESFYGQDANMTYAVSGLYNRFLLDMLGGKKYIKLYKTVNGDINYVKQIKPNGFSLPSIEQFDKFLEIRDKEKIMYVDEKDNLKPEFNFQGVGGSIAYLEDYYKFFIFNYFFIGPSKKEIEDDIHSKIIPSIINNPLNDCNSYAKYCVTTDSSSVKIYNLYNDELIFNFNSSFSIFNTKIPVYTGNGGKQYTFFLSKEIFNHDLDKDIVIGGCYR